MDKNNFELIIFQREPFCRVSTDEEYDMPEGKDLRFLRKIFELTQVDVAKILGVQWNSKGSSTVSKWEVERNKFDHRQIPYSAWRLLLITLNVVAVEDYEREK